MTETATAVASPGVDQTPGDETVDAFEERISRLLEMVEENPAIRDRMLCEMYVTISEFSESFRMIQAQMQAMGPKAMLSMLTGRGNGFSGDSE